MAAVAVTLGPPQAVGTTWWRGRARDFHRSIRRRYEARCAFVRAWRRNSSAQWNFERRVWSIWARHLAPDDRERVVVRTHQLNWYRGMVDGLMVMPLSEFGTTHTAMVRWAPGTYFNPHRHFGGEEIFVVEGVFSDEHGNYPQGSWIRSPHLSQHQPFSVEGCSILIKTGHLLT